MINEPVWNRYSKVVLLLVICVVSVMAEDHELKLVHVIFRHGDRTPASPESGERYPNDPYLNETFFPLGAGSLTNVGMTRMYEFGVFLRRRYDDFLGKIYHNGLAKTRSSGSQRAMISAQLTNAGLWPPSQIQQWNNDLPWIPIPYEYVPAEIDHLMISYLCPAYKKQYEKIMQSDEVRNLVDPHLEFFDYLSEHTGANITTPRDAFLIYHTLEAERNCNLTLPSWTNGYYPDGELYNVTLLAYEISAWGDLLKKIYGGPLIREALNDFEKFIDNTSPKESTPKITLYSGHESNIFSVLKALGVWTPHVPDFSSAVIFELRSNDVTDEFVVEVLYHLGKSRDTIPLTIPGCTQLCPIHEFTRLLSNVIPDDVHELCRGDITAEEN